MTAGHVLCFAWGCLFAVGVMAIRKCWHFIDDLWP